MALVQLFINLTTGFGGDHKDNPAPRQNLLCWDDVTSGDNLTSADEAQDAFEPKCVFGPDGILFRGTYFLFSPDW